MPDHTATQQATLRWAHSVWLRGFYAGRQAALDSPAGSLEMDPVELSPYIDYQETH